MNCRDRVVQKDRDVRDSDYIDWLEWAWVDKMKQEVDSEDWLHTHILTMALADCSWIWCTCKSYQHDKTSWKASTKTANVRWDDDDLSDFFKICSEVRQGCVLSLLLFGIVMDWVMTNSVQECADTEWADDSQLGDFDFADDVALLHDSWDGMQALTSKLETQRLLQVLLSRKHCYYCLLYTSPSPRD